VALSFLRPRSIASYSTILLMYWNSILAAYEVFNFKGEIITTAAPAAKEPQDPSQK
jgi:hypothetical protein